MNYAKLCCLTQSSLFFTTHTFSTWCCHYIIPLVLYGQGCFVVVVVVWFLVWFFFPVCFLLLLFLKEIPSCLTKHMSLSQFFLIQINNLVCMLKPVYYSCAKCQCFSLLLMIQDPGPVLTKVRKRRSQQPTQEAITQQYERSHLTLPADKKSIQISALNPVSTEKAVQHPALRWIWNFLATASAQAAVMILSSGSCSKGKALFSIQAQGLAHGSCTRNTPQACTEVEFSAKLLNTSFSVKAVFQWQADVVWQPFV